VISIKKFLSLNTETDHTLMHVVRLLVQGIGQHVVAGDVNDTARFRKNIADVSEALGETIAPAELLVHAGSVVQALEDYTSRTSRQQHLQTAEMQTMVKMLTSTVGIVSSASNTSVSRLGEIEKQVAVASALGDVRTIKARLSDCLADIRKEVQRQQKETGATIEELTQGLDEARRRSGNLSATGLRQDDVTRLPVRAEAETALTEAVKSGVPAFAAVFVLDRLQALNQRFGHEVGDEILTEFTRIIRRQLPADDRLFRWGGPTLMGLVMRPGTVERVRSEVGRLMDSRWEHTIQTPSRSILLPIAMRWAVFPMMAAPRLLFHKIDVFAGSSQIPD
jgi:diguanylate cyclase (GGDEF)-like protein